MPRIIYPVAESESWKRQRALGEYRHPSLNVDAVVSVKNLPVSPQT